MTGFFFLSKYQKLTRLESGLVRRQRGGTSALSKRAKTSGLVRRRSGANEVSVVKAQMDIFGMAGGPVRPPLVNITDAEMNELRTMSEGWQPIL